MDSELHAGLHEVEVNASNLGIGDTLGHSLRRDATVQSITVNEAALLCAPTVSFENIHAVDRVLDLTLQTAMTD